MGRITHYPQLTYWAQPTPLEQSHTAHAPPTHPPTPIRHSMRQSDYTATNEAIFDRLKIRAVRCFIGGGVVGEGGPKPLSPFPPKKTFYAWQYLWHRQLQGAHCIFWPQKTQELPKKQWSKAAWTTTYLCISQIDYGRTRHCEDCLCQRTTQMVFWKIWVWVCEWLSARWTPRPPSQVSKRSAASVFCSYGTTLPL